MPYRLTVDEYVSSLMRNERNLDELGNIIRREGCKSYAFAPLFGVLDNHFMTVGDDLEDANVEHSEFLMPKCGSSLSGVRTLISMAKRLCCLHRVIGVLGNKEDTTFTVRLYIVVARDGSVYGYDMSLNRVSRLAESLRMFFRIGGRKSVYNFRFSRGNHGIRRLERFPVCPHMMKTVKRVLDDGSVCESHREPGEAFSLRGLTGFGETVGFRDYIPESNPDFDIVQDVGVSKSDGRMAIDLCRYLDIQYVLECVRRRHRGIDNMWADELTVIAESSMSCLYRRDINLKAALMALVKEAEDINDDDDLSDDNNPTKWARFMFTDPCKRCAGHYRLKVHAQCRNGVSSLFK